MAKVKCFLVDDNEDTREELKRHFSQNSCLEIVGEAKDGVEAISQISLVRPDVVVLDIVMPVLDGYGVLEYFKNDREKPKFIMFSALCNDNFVFKAFELGADDYMAKPCQVEMLEKRLISLTSKNKNDKIALFEKSESKVSYRARSLNEKITSIFITVGIPAHIKGYQFLREGIKMTVETPDIINSITKKLYPSIAEKFSTTASKVERAIRHAIEVSWNRGKIENINSLFGLKVYSSHEKPTNGEFIALVADKMLIEGV